MPGLTQSSVNFVMRQIGQGVAVTLGEDPLQRPVPSFSGAVTLPTPPDIVVISDAPLYRDGNYTEAPQDDASNNSKLNAALSWARHLLKQKEKSTDKTEIDFNWLLLQAIKRKDYGEIIRLRSLYAADYYCNSPNKLSKDPVKVIYNLKKQFKRVLSISSDHASNGGAYGMDIDAQSAFKYQFERMARFPIPEPAKEQVDPITGEKTGEFDYSLWQFSNGVKFYGSSYRIANYVKLENKNLDETAELSLNVTAGVASFLAFLTTLGIVAFPFSGVALSAIASITSFLRGLKGLGVSMWGMYTADNMDDYQDHAKEFTSSFLKVGLFIAFAGLIAAGPYGLIIGTVLLGLLALPDIKNSALVLPYVRHAHKYYEKYVPKPIKTLIYGLATPFRWGAELTSYLIGNISRSIVRRKLRKETAKRIKYALDNAADDDEVAPGMTVAEARQNYRFSHANMPKESYRSELDGMPGITPYQSAQSALNQVLRGKAQEKLAEEIIQRAASAGISGNSPEEIFMQLSLTSINKHNKKAKKIYALYKIYQQNQRGEMPLKFFHDLHKRLGKFGGGTDVDLKGCHQSFFRVKAGFTKIFAEMYTDFLEQSDGASFGESLVEIINEKSRSLTGGLFHKVKREALNDLLVIIIDSKNYTTVEEYENAAEATKAILETYYRINYGFWAKSETAEIFDYATTYFSKRICEIENVTKKNKALEEARCQEALQTLMAQPQGEKLFKEKKLEGAARKIGPTQRKTKENLPSKTRRFNFLYFGFQKQQRKEPSPQFCHREPPPPTPPPLSDTSYVTHHKGSPCF